MLNGGWKSSEYGGWMYYSHAENGRIDGFLSMASSLLGTRDGYSIGVALIVTDEVNKLDQVLYAESSVIEGMDSFDGPIT